MLKKWNKISVKQPAAEDGSYYVREYNSLDEFMEGASILHCIRCGASKSMFADENKCGCGATGETWVPAGALWVVRETAL